jgi:beta-lactamase class A
MAAKSKSLIYVLATAFANIWMTAYAADTGNQQSTNSQARLQRALEALAERAHPGLLGITVIDLKTGEETRVNASQAYRQAAMNVGGHYGRFRPQTDASGVTV